LSPSPVTRVAPGKFNYLGYNIPIGLYENKDLGIKLNKCNQVCGRVSTVLNKEKRKDTHRVLHFYKMVAIQTLTYNSEVWTSTNKQQQRI
jgi:hypothetical protein